MRNFQMKQALGLAVSGTEVRLAHLVNQNGQIRIAGLERARLQTTLENQATDNEPSKLEEAEARDVFGVKEPLGEKSFGEKESRPSGPKAENGNSGNLEILYRLLEKYTQKKVKIAFNVPLSMVTYQRPELVGRAEGIDKDRDSSLAQEVVVGQDGTRLIMSYEKHPSTMTLMREVNDFLRGNLFLALMDSTEVALANLARRSYECEPGKVTAIIYIEDDFTRLIFLRGQDLFHVSSIIHENTASPDILEVIYRKLIYEQDEVQIPEMATIFLAGKSSRINAAEFFAAHFATASVQYLSSSLVGNSPATSTGGAGTQAGLFSEFAVPIALAWKTLEPKSPSFIPTNLLPQDLLDQQQVLKLNYQGYVLLAITGLVAFFLTWQILDLNGSIREMRKKNLQLQSLIANNQGTVDRVHELDNQCQRLSKSMALADSLGRKHDEFLVFLRKLNAGLGKVGNIWVDEIVTHGDGFSVQGSSMNRDAIPLLAEKLGNASLRQMTRMEADKKKWFGFSLERSNTPDSLKAFAQGLSTIEAGRYAGNGKLILSKEGIRPAPEVTTPNANGVASLPAIAKPEQASVPPEADKKRQAVANGTASAPPMAAPQTSRLAAGVRQAATTPPPVKSNAFDKNETKAATTRQADVPAPSTKDDARRQTPVGIESKTPVIFAENATRTRPSEERSSDVASNRSKANGAAPAQKLMNGTTAGAERQQFDQAGELRSVQMQPASSPAASVSTASQPENAPPEIFRGFSIEAATSYTKELAEQFVATYRKQGYDAAIERYQDERTNAQKYRVLIGAFPTRPAAERKAAQMAGILMKDYRVVGLK